VEHGIDYAWSILGKGLRGGEAGRPGTEMNAKQQQHKRLPGSWVEAAGTQDLEMGT